MPETFAEIVGSLEDSGLTGLFVQKRDNRIHVFDVFAAKKIGNGLEALLIHVDPQILPKIDEWPLSEGFQIEIRRAPDGNNAASLLCLELCSAQFREVFLALAEDVCGLIEGETDAERAIQAVLIRLTRWQEFLQRHRLDGLSEEKRLGLFGELSVLRGLFLETLGPILAVRGWRGCKRANQDFQHPGFALEVKTTKTVTPERIHVSNVQQLDEEGIDSMFLSLVCVEQSDSVGLTLPSIVAALRESMAGTALAMFNEGLMEVGYLDTHQAVYERTRYEMKDIMTFAVAGEFPRMRRGQIPDGIKDLKYQISVEACRPYLIEHSSLLDAVRNLRAESAS